ncbi:MAG: hypothetical protein GVY07_16615 [Bacteroidetes bacterium]|nr:hypothetical protein [Bacteroidota bacterium]
MSCNDVAQINGTEQSSELVGDNTILGFDGNPVISISDADYYNGNSEYINKVIERLSSNGETIIEAMNTQLIGKANKAQEAETGTEAIIIGLSELRSTRTYKSNSIKKSYSLDDLSSEIRVVDNNGDVERFELVLEPHQGGNITGKSRSVSFNAASTWLALNPDHFYVTEDAEGNEIWPVSFPAVSIDNSERIIEVSLDRDGTLSWPSNVQSKSRTTIQSTHNNLVYLDNLAILEPCFQDYDVQPIEEICGDDTGGGGIGDSPNDYGPNPPDRFLSSEIETVPFLAIKTIRLDGTGDGSGSAELQMHVDPSYVTYDDNFRRGWQYTFDHKRGINNRPLWFNDFSFFSLFSQSFRLYTNISGTIRSSAESVFSGRNTRTFAADTRIYQTPDVNNENVDYNFTNMRTWSYYNFPAFGSSYGEGSQLNYFPIVPLNNTSRWRVLLMEDDKNYPYASGNGRSTLAHNVQTFNMGNGTYNNIYTKVDANNHSNGSSDDLMWHSGISNITEANVNARLGGDSQITAVSPGGFKYVLKKIFRTAEVRPAN